MGIKAVISLVSIEACGLYSSNGRNFKYGDINSVLVNLSQWADKKPLGLTKTFEGDDKHNPCYLYDIYTDQEDWLIAMWNETESNDGTVASVDSQAIVGKASISSTNLPKNNIPGFPTYFWVLPKEKLVASIKFEYRKTGVQELALYLQSHSLFSLFSHAMLSRSLVKITMPCTQRFWDIYSIVVMHQKTYVPG